MCVQLFANPKVAARKGSVAVQRLEAQMHHAALLHQKALQDRRRQLAALRAGARRKAGANAALEAQVAALAASLDAQAPVLDRASPEDASQQCAHSLCLACAPLLPSRRGSPVFRTEWLTLVVRAGRCGAW